MSLLVVSRQLDLDADHGTCRFDGLPEYADKAAFVADQLGWNTTDGGATKTGAWIALAKFEDDAATLTSLHHAFERAELVGRLSPIEP